MQPTYKIKGELVFRPRNDLSFLTSVIRHLNAVQSFLFHQFPPHSSQPACEDLLSIPFDIHLTTLPLLSQSLGSLYIDGAFFSAPNASIC